MTAPAHALTGALIGLSISNPAIALPLAVASHFVCDVIPHYDEAEQDTVKRISSRRFWIEFVAVSAGLCFLIVLALAMAHPKHWFTAALCAFLATSPDAFWLRRFLHARRTGTDIRLNAFLRFHEAIQWKTGPKLIWVEVIWLVGMTLLIIPKLA